MQRLLVDQMEILQTRLDDMPQTPLAGGAARLRLQSFALTANNVTYAVLGFAVGYWKFFPSGLAGQGLVPVWGTAEVVESRSDALKTGTRLYGFYPLAEELVIVPQADGYGAIVDGAPHRADMPAVYNRYTPVRAGDAREDHMRALLQPLLATSYLIYDWLMDNDCFGATQIIVGSASSKTGLGLCKYLAEPQDRPYRIIGLTSRRNHGFVDALGACDRVLIYDDIADLPQEPSVYVDMSGNGAVKQRVHARLSDLLKHSSAVGISHWDQFAPQIQLEGPKPQFFFAPAQIAKRRAEWGPGEIENRITRAWKRLAADAPDWLDLKEHHGIGKAADVWTALADGTADPRHGHIITL